MNKNIEWINVGSDFSGVGAFDQALRRLGIPYKTVFSCDMDKYARQTYVENYGEPEYYPENVYDREIPEKSLDIYMTSPPCFTGETLINTNLGFKPICEISIGDLVLTHENRYRKVIDFGSKESKIYSLKAQGIIETFTTSNHRYYVIERYRQWNSKRRCDERKFTEPKWVQVEDLTKNHFVGVNIPQENENPFEIDCDTAYVLGRYVADGWIRDRSNEKGKTKGNALILAIGKDKTYDISKRVKLKHTLLNDVNGVSKLFIYSNELVSLVKKTGLGHGAINKRIPQSIINLPNSILQHFVNGYMDGDGHSDKDYFRATSVSKELLMGLQLCLSKLYRVNSNIKLTKTPDKAIIQGRTVNQRDYYVLEFRKEMKKQSNAVVIGNVIWYPIREITETNEERKVFDITVEEDHSFTANQAIVHNCQAFSLAGKRKGEDDKRGILFYNSHEFIQKNNPRYFIIENVKGLLSDDSGKTFQRWCDYLGGKTVNGNPSIFPHEESVPYHIYWRVLNAKHYGVPQNRERVFIVGIRDDNDNRFMWPKEEPLKKKLKDVLEEDVDEKYYLSEKMILGFITHTERMKEKGNGFSFTPTDGNKIASSVTTKNGSRPDDNFIKVKSATSKGYETASEGDSINLSQPESKTRRGRVGKEVAQTLDTACNQAVMIGAIRGRNPDNPKSRESGLPTQQMLEINESGVSNALTTVQKDNVVVSILDNSHKNEGVREYFNESPCLNARDYKEPRMVKKGHTIRRLTERECFRLMDFDESFLMPCSSTQMYKQAGNSIVVGVLAKLISKLNLPIKTT